MYLWAIGKALAQVGLFSTSSSLDSDESCVENDVGDQTKALLLNEEVLKEACKQRIGINVVKGIEEERGRSGMRGMFTFFALGARDRDF